MWALVPHVKVSGVISQNGMTDGHVLAKLQTQLEVGIIALLVSLSLHAVPYSYGYWETDTVIALMLFAEISKPSDMALCDVVGTAVYFNL